MLTKHECTCDKRNIIIKLTESGLEVLDELIKIDIKFKKQMFGEAPKSEQAYLEEEIRKMAENLK